MEQSVIKTKKNLCRKNYDSAACRQINKSYTDTKKVSNSKPCWYLIYNKTSSTKNGLKTDSSSLSTC